MSNQKIYTLSQALNKAMKYCAYQERCQQEVFQRVFEWSRDQDLANEVVAELIIQGFLNEERFARSFVRGKFNQKSWGRLKITQALKQKEISSACIQLGMEEIEEELYLERLANLCTKKISEHGKSYDGKLKVARFLYQRGFENNLIWETINSIAND